MHAKEMGLTGLALSLLAGWEISIGEIPLGLFSISYSGHSTLFATVITIKLLVSATLLTRSLLRLNMMPQQLAGGLRSVLLRGSHAVESKPRPSPHHRAAPRPH